MADRCGRNFSLCHWCCLGMCQTELDGMAQILRPALPMTYPLRMSRRGPPCGWRPRALGCRPCNATDLLALPSSPMRTYLLPIVLSSSTIIRSAVICWCLSWMRSSRCGQIPSRIFCLVWLLGARYFGWLGFSEQASGKRGQGPSQG